MSDELESKENPGNPGENEDPDCIGNGAATPDELEFIKAELEAERATLAEAQAALTERDSRIAGLEAALSEAKQGSEALTGELAAAREAHASAISHYLNAQRALHPAIPEGIIRGESVRDIDDSVGMALSIADAVKAGLAAEAKNARVPAGAPTRAVNLDALSPGEKISLGLQQQKGGTS